MESNRRRFLRQSLTTAAGLAATVLPGKLFTEPLTHRPLVSRDKGMPMKVAKSLLRFSAIGLNHGHIYGQCNGLLEAGAELKWVYDADAKKEIAIIDSIINRKYLNEAGSGANSTMTAILGRECAAVCRKMSWEELNRSSQQFDTQLDLSKFD